MAHKHNKPPGVSLRAPTTPRPGGNFGVARDEVFSIHDGNPKTQIPIHKSHIPNPMGNSTTMRAVFPFYLGFGFELGVGA